MMKCPLITLFKNDIYSYLNSLILNRTVFKSLGNIDEKLTIGEDFDLYARLLSQYKVLLLNERYICKYRFNIHGLMNSSNNFQNRLNATKKIISTIEKYSKKCNINKKKVKFIISKKYLDFIDKSLFILIQYKFKNGTNNWSDYKLALKYMTSYLFDKKYQNLAFLKRLLKLKLKVTLLLLPQYIFALYLKKNWKIKSVFKINILNTK